MGIEDWIDRWLHVELLLADDTDMGRRRAGALHVWVAVGLGAALLAAIVAAGIRGELRKSTTDFYGRAVNSAGRAVAGWPVRVISIYDSGLGDGPTQQWAVHKLITDSDGRFCCTDLKASTILVQMHGVDGDGGEPSDYRYDSPYHAFGPSQHVVLGSADQPITFNVDSSSGR